MNTEILRAALQVLVKSCPYCHLLPKAARRTKRFACNLGQTLSKSPWLILCLSTCLYRHGVQPSTLLSPNKLSALNLSLTEYCY